MTIYTNEAEADSTPIEYAKKSDMFTCGSISVRHTGNNLLVCCGKPQNSVIINPHEAEQLLSILHAMARYHNLCPLPQITLES